MRTYKWEEIAGKHFTPVERKEMQAAAYAASERMGYGALRRARSMTQVELAERLSVSQASVAEMEGRTDLHLSTLARYIRALGGELEIRAVFPEGAFNLEPLPVPDAGPAKPKRTTPARGSRRVARRRSPEEVPPSADLQPEELKRAGRSSPSPR